MDYRIVRVRRVDDERATASELAQFVGYANAVEYARWRLEQARGRCWYVLVERQKSGKFLVMGDQFSSVKPRSLNDLLELLEKVAVGGLWSDKLPLKMLVEPLPRGEAA